MGSDDGLVHLTRDGGANWTKVTPPGMPEWGTVESIEASRHAAGTAYVVVDNHRMDDYRPYVWGTTDYGKSWKSLAAGLPQDRASIVLKEDTLDPELLFAGTERGVYISRDGGKAWESLKLNMPTVSVTDLAVKGNDLVVGTRGRSIWILDNFAPLRADLKEAEGKAVHLLAPERATAWRGSSTWTSEAMGQNPPRGALLDYRLKDKATGEVVLEIFDAKGRLVQKLSSTVEQPEYPEDDPDEPSSKPEPELKTEPGLHRAVWRLTYEGADRLDRAKVDLGNPRRGPAAPPGAYRLRLTANGATSEATLEVKPDPRSKVSQAELEAQLEMSLTVRAAINRTIAAIKEVRSIREQATALAALLAEKAEAKDLKGKAEQLAARCDTLEGKLHNPEAQVVYDILAKRGTKLYSNLIFVYETVGWGDGAPTQGAKEVFAELEAELKGYEKELADLEATDVKAVDEMAKGLGLARILTR